MLQSPPSAPASARRISVRNRVNIMREALRDKSLTDFQIRIIGNMLFDQPILTPHDLKWAEEIITTIEREGRIGKEDNTRLCPKCHGGGLHESGELSCNECGGTGEKRIGKEGE